MNADEPHNPEQGAPEQIAASISRDCTRFKTQRTRGELGAALARVVLLYSPRDIRQMEQNFGNSIRDLTPEYRKELEDAITGHLLGTYQMIRLMGQQGTFRTKTEPLTEHEHAYWDMVIAQCRPGTGDFRLRFFKIPARGVLHDRAAGTGPPGRDAVSRRDWVELIDGVYYCPVREKAGDVDTALCPFCPAQQTPAVGYLKPPVNASGRRKQEFIDNCYRYHNFNG